MSVLKWEVDFSVPDWTPPEVVVVIPGPLLVGDGHCGLVVDHLESGISWNLTFFDWAGE